MKKLFFAFLALHLSTASAEVCSYEDQNLQIQAEVTMVSPDKVTSTLMFNGEEIPAVASKCHERNVPGRSGYLCMHRDQYGQNYDLYPRVNSQSGTFESANLLLWTGGEIQKFELTCE